MLRIRIPASTANLGSGFDSLGIALNLYNYIEIGAAPGCEISSADGSEIPTGEDNLIFLSAKKVYEKAGLPFRGLKIIEENKTIILLSGPSGSGKNTVINRLLEKRFIGKTQSYFFIYFIIFCVIIKIIIS